MPEFKKISLPSSPNPRLPPPSSADTIITGIHTSRRRFFYGLVILGLLLGLGGALLVGKNAFSLYSFLSRISTASSTSQGLLGDMAALALSEHTSLIGEVDDRINILLLGIGGDGHDGGNLSDTNMLISVKPSTRQAALMSIPRDLRVELPDYGFQKINAANAVGENLSPGNGGDYARSIFSQTFGLEIPYYIRINFAGFADVIDALGGITIDVPNGFADKSYPGPNNSYRTVSFAPGAQQMDGDTALIYARSRHGTNNEGSDFARSRRQQFVMEAVKDTAASLSLLDNPNKLSGVLGALSGDVVTNLSPDQLVYLALLGKSIDQSSIIAFGLDDEPDNYLGQFTTVTTTYMLAPKGGSFERINELLQNIFTTSPI